jgi:hypothetical protein
MPRLGKMMSTTLPASLQKFSSAGAGSSGADKDLSILQQPKSTLGSYFEFWQSMDSAAGSNHLLSALIKQLSSKSSADGALGAPSLHSEPSLPLPFSLARCPSLPRFVPANH